MILRSLACLLAPLAAQAAVILNVDNDAFAVAPGGTFQVNLTLEITGGVELIGFDAFWRADPPASGLFTLTDRDTTGSLITDAYPFSGGMLLAPQSTNIGGLTDFDVILSNGTYFLGTYVFTASSLAAPADYQLAITPGATWLASDFSEAVFASLPSLSISVNAVPDAAATGLLLLVGLCGCTAVRRQVTPRSAAVRRRT